MEVSAERRKNENLEVTGVSRSGRVRKKSSKLMDFESPDEVDNKKKRSPDQTPRGVKPIKIQKPLKIKQEEHEEDDYNSYNANVSAETDSDTDVYKQEDDSYEVDDDDEIDEDDDDDDYTEGQLVVDEKTPTQSLYMSEKNKKRGTVIRDGKVVIARKPRRKDKGKSRFTAYMMWAKEVRQALSKQFPDMDFTTMARRLSELWATVPNSEREHWKRKAKRESIKKAKSKPDAPLMPSRKFINKKGGPIAPLLNSPSNQPPKQVSAETQQQSKVSPRKVNSDVSPSSSSLAKTSGIDPIDVASHLKLLGESLSVIGERLQEHEGQIAVSGSISVLLDSLLCSMGQLLCLTHQLPQLDINQQLLSNIIGTSAYIMPGLG